MNSVRIERLSLGGDGVARLPSTEPGRSGTVVFVPFSAPDDVVRLGSLKKEKSFARGWIESLEKPSSQRTQPRCPLFFTPGRRPHDVCGGCDWQHLSFSAQTEAKRALLVETLQRVGKIARPAVENTVGPDSPEQAWRYRNKGLVPFARDAAGHVVAGFYAPGSHTVVPMDSCPVQTERFDQTVQAAREWLSQNGAPLCVDDADREGVKHLLVRTSSTGDALAALVTTSQPGTDVNAFARHLKKTCPFLTSVFHNINDRPGNVVLGPRWRRVWGKDYLEERLLGLRFHLSPASFFQINHSMAEKLYSLAVDMADPAPTDVVWELYAGVGAMGQLLARRAKQVWAVEENAQAVRNGIESLQWNGITNLRFRQGRCELVLARSLIKDVPQIVLLDPPRAGCEKTVLKILMRSGPRKMVYVSCDPATLARDAQYLSTGGYHLRRSVPVDLFPQTAHVESVSLFERSR